jgi:hypothetical protein
MAIFLLDTSVIIETVKKSAALRELQQTLNCPLPSVAQAFLPVFRINLEGRFLPAKKHRQECLCYSGRLARVFCLPGEFFHSFLQPRRQRRMEFIKKV